MEPSPESGHSECACDGQRDPLPVLGLDSELTPAGWRQLVEPRPPVRVGFPPFAGEPAVLFETMESGKERARADVEGAPGHLLDAPGDPQTVSRLVDEALENEQIERASEQIRLFRHEGLLSGSDIGTR